MKEVLHGHVEEPAKPSWLRRLATGITMGQELQSDLRIPLREKTSTATDEVRSANFGRLIISGDIKTTEQLEAFLEQYPLEPLQ